MMYRVLVKTKDGRVTKWRIRATDPDDACTQVHNVMMLAPPHVGLDRIMYLRPLKTADEI